VTHDDVLGWLVEVISTACLASALWTLASALWVVWQDVRHKGGGEA
jgi:hypothetical protein